MLEVARRASFSEWLLVSAFLAAKYLIDDLGPVKGLAQRLGQVALGAWLAALGVGVGAAVGADAGHPTGERPGVPLDLKRSAQQLLHPFSW